MAVCNRHWQYLYRYGELTPPPTEPINPLPLCCVKHCKDVVRSRNAGMCEKHYGRRRRGVCIADDRPIVGRYLTGDGYIRVLNRAHPLAAKNGHVFEHRLVAYDQHSGVCPPCYWCSLSLEWASAVIDHFNENKSDNSPGNLLVACSPCNRARGAIKPFLQRMREEALESFFIGVRALRRHEPERDYETQGLEGQCPPAGLYAQVGEGSANLLGPTPAVRDVLSAGTGDGGFSCRPQDPT